MKICSFQTTTNTGLRFFLHPTGDVLNNNTLHASASTMYRAPLVLDLGLVPDGDVFTETAWHLGRLPQGQERAVAVSGVNKQLSPLHGVSGAQRLFPTTDSSPWSVWLRQSDLSSVSPFGLWL